MKSKFNHRAGKPQHRNMEKGTTKERGAHGATIVQPTITEQGQRTTISTLLVPYTVGGILQSSMQKAEDKFVELTGSQRVRIVEKGGETLGNLLGRNDPWSSRRVCPDPGCNPCKSRTWIKQQKVAAKKSGMSLPKVLITKTSNQCRREGATYVLQCLDCALVGKGSYYQGETSRSARQCQDRHAQDLAQGMAASPLVVHAVQVHGGVRPKILSIIKNVEPRPLYRVVRESVSISMQPWGDGNMNRCQEWGAPRVPILTVRGAGDPEDGPGGGGGGVVHNKNPVWSRMILDEIEIGSRKRVRLRDNENDEDPENAEEFDPEARGKEKRICLEKKVDRKGKNSQDRRKKKDNMTWKRKGVKNDNDNEKVDGSVIKIIEKVVECENDDNMVRFRDQTVVVETVNENEDQASSSIITTTVATTVEVTSEESKKVQEQVYTFGARDVREKYKQQTSCNNTRGRGSNLRGGQWRLSHPQQQVVPVLSTRSWRPGCRRPRGSALAAQQRFMSAWRSPGAANMPMITPPPLPPSFKSPNTSPSTGQKAGAGVTPMTPPPHYGPEVSSSHPTTCDVPRSSADDPPPPTGVLKVPTGDPVPAKTEGVGADGRDGGGDTKRKVSGDRDCPLTTVASDVRGVKPPGDPPK